MAQKLSFSKANISYNYKNNKLCLNLNKSRQIYNDRFPYEPYLIDKIILAYKITIYTEDFIIPKYLVLIKTKQSDYDILLFNKYMKLEKWHTNIKFNHFTDFAKEKLKSHKLFSEESDLLKAKIIYQFLFHF